ncbi:MAG: glycosyltransferase family 2 protein [Clostridia bacterium]|nr:glycosyltransferase family 2 protein [Clostridia bacterium]
MKISVIIPVYNTADYLSRCVLSVLTSRNRDKYEIILVDDGSTDGRCPALCDELASENPGTVRVIHQENAGLGGARNTGIHAASGEYLFFLDSDDTLTDGAVDRLAKTAEKYNCDVISFGILSEDEDSGRLTPVQSNAFYSEEPFTLSDHPEFLLSLPNAWGRIWKKTLFENSGILYPTRVWYEDIRTSSKLFAAAESIVTVRDEYYRYLQRSGSIMHSSNIDRNREIIDAFEDILSWYKENGLFDKYKDILCRLCIDHVYIAASVRVLRGNVKHPLLKELREYLASTFPDYRDNPYVGILPKSKRLVYFLLEKKMYRTVALLFRIKR